MYEGKLVFAQVMDFLPRHAFDKAVRRYQGNRRVRGFSCRDQFLAMAFAQLTYRESLRDIETCLRSVKSKLYHLGFRGNISRSTLADANRTRDWRIYADFAQVLIERARALYVDEPLGFELANAAYALADHCYARVPLALPVPFAARALRPGVSWHSPARITLHKRVRAFHRIVVGATVHPHQRRSQWHPEMGLSIEERLRSFFRTRPGMNAGPNTA